LKSFDVIVVGLGAVGSATALALARRGCRVLGLDRFSPPHRLGSHSGHTRLIRMTYFEHPDYVPLLRRAYELWRQLEADSGCSILATPGGLYTGPSGGAFIEGTLRSADRHALAMQRVDERELENRFAGFTLPPGHAALFDPSAGYLFSDVAIEQHLHLARACAATVQTDSAVVDWRADGDGVRVTTATDEYAAGSLVLTAGPWMPGLARLKVPLRITHQWLAWFGTGAGDQSRHAPGVVWASEDDEGSLFYGFPAMDHPEFGTTLKVARHVPGRTLAEPGERAAAIDDEREKEILAGFVQRRMPTLAGPIVGTQSCLYTISPDQHFVMGLHPEHPHVAFASACSGHGFKFAPVLGEVMADLATSGRTEKPVDFLGIGRF